VRDSRPSCLARGSLSLMKHFEMFAKTSLRERPTCKHRRTTGRPTPGATQQCASALTSAGDNSPRYCRRSTARHCVPSGRLTNGPCLRTSPPPCVLGGRERQKNGSSEGWREKTAEARSPPGEAARAERSKRRRTWWEVGGEERSSHSRRGKEASHRWATEGGTRGKVTSSWGKGGDVRENRWQEKESMCGLARNTFERGARGEKDRPQKRSGKSSYKDELLQSMQNHEQEVESS
jgi:hypothetical protein